MQLKIKQLISFFSLSSIFTLLYIFSIYQSSYSLIPIFLIIVILIAIYLVRYDLPLVLFWFFLFLFPFDFLLGLYSGGKLLPVYKFEYLNQVFYSFSISISILASFMKDSSRRVVFIGHGLSLIRSDTILYIYILAAFALTVSIKGNISVFSENSYSQYQDNLRMGSGIIEYVLMIFIAILFFRKSSVLLFLCVACISFYIVKMFLLGFRVQTIVGVLILFFMIRNKHPKPILNIMLCFCSFLFMLSYGIIKEGVNIIDDGVTFNVLLDTRYGYIQSHQHGVLSSSSVILSHPLPNDIPSVLLIPSTFLASILPRFLLDSYIPFVYPSAYVQTFEYTPGGGIFSTQIFHLLGTAGLLFLSFLLAMTFRLYLVSKSVNIFVVSAITLLCFFPRWVSYDFFNFGMRTILIVLFLVYTPKFFFFMKVRYARNL
ncbi:hypothetical protein K9823_003382 [Vibrio cholerae]|nr:hypothetical protein [Vibrio cholerae]EJL6912654.1 hypothetical protein [Vibrio cholerae]ELH5152244.1 hypothetical protein [Vibrio cholerae]